MVEQDATSDKGHIFAPWFDNLVKLLGAGAAFGGLYAVLLVNYGLSPKALNVGYMPTQPVPYNHELHAGQLGIDCRFCHTGVEDGAHASIPPTQTCMNCHAMVGKESAKLAPLRESYNTGLPVEWIRIHDLPDYAYFNHSAHVNRGVGCVECHGRIDQMVEVALEKPLSMGWCLDCHRNPTQVLRPNSEITNMGWGEGMTPPEREEIGRTIAIEDGLLVATDSYHQLSVKERQAKGTPALIREGYLEETNRFSSLTNCSTCHR